MIKNFFSEYLPQQCKHERGQQPMAKLGGRDVWTRQPAVEGKPGGGKIQTNTKAYEKNKNEV